VGFLGTWKNTGKTTALAATMAVLAERNMSVALTSIGYDGELQDTITGLPKPKIVPVESTLVATTESCARVSPARLVRIATTDVNTPLGKVALFRVARPGKVAVAGPNNRRDLSSVLSAIRDQRPDMTLVDGALSRAYPLAEVDAVVLCTGAARLRDTDMLEREAEAICCILHIGTPPAATECSQWDALVTPGIIESWHKPNIMLDTPMALLASHEPIPTWDAILRARFRGVQVYVKKPIRLSAITLNPTYPLESKSGYDRYETLDLRPTAKRLKLLGVRVVDVVAEGAGALLDAIVCSVKHSAAGVLASENV